MSVSTDYPDYAPHVAAANQIAATGVPLLHKPGQVVNDTARIIAGGGSQPYALQPIVQPGYSAEFQVSFPVGTATPFVNVELQWTDLATGFIVETDNFVLPGATGAQKFYTVGSGPAKANQVAVLINNLDATSSATVTFTLNQDSVPRFRDRWHWANALDITASVPGLNLPLIVPDESVLGVLDGVTIPASSQNSYLFGMHDGMVNIGFEVNTGSVSNLTIKVRPKPDSSYSGHNIIYSGASPTSNFQIAGSRAPLGIIVANSATVSMVMSLSAITAD